MSYLEQVKTGKVKKPSIDLIFGGSGVGKTTWASEAPKPIFLPTEEGTNFLDVARLPLAKTFVDVLGSIDELLTKPHDYVTLVIDSLDHLEFLIWREVCAENKIKEINDLGYGKGYALAVQKWQLLLDRMKIMREKMNIILICHAQVKQISDPMKLEAYDRHELKLNKSAGALIKESVDSVLFATYELDVIKDDKGKARAYGTGRRVLYTQSMPGHEGKNRYGLPYELPLSYEDFAKAKEAAEPENPATLRRTIQQHIDGITDAELKTKAEKYLQDAGRDAIVLSKLLNRLKALKKET